MFISLTQKPNSVVYVNVNEITHYKGNENGSLIYLTSDKYLSLDVKETPEEINVLIHKSKQPQYVIIRPASNSRQGDQVAYAIDTISQVVKETETGYAIIGFNNGTMAVSTRTSFDELMKGLAGRY